jgi:hypothetical protein
MIVYTAVTTWIADKIKWTVTKISTWIVVVSIVITAFSAFPSWPSIWLHTLNVPLLILALAQAHHEGRRSVRYPEPSKTLGEIH